MWVWPQLIKCAITPKCNIQSLWKLIYSMGTCEGVALQQQSVVINSINCLIYLIEIHC